MYLTLKSIDIRITYPVTLVPGILNTFILQINIYLLKYLQDFNYTEGFTILIFL
jgi:hypothetical protein